MIQYSIPTSKKALLLFVCKTGTLANLWIYCCAPVRVSYCEPFSGRKRIKIYKLSVNALKVTWIRRFITGTCKWQDYILKYVNIETLTAVDTKYAEEIMENR